ncbi:hypothetical protein QE152_g26646 [Popillia japonica]|uniref:Uncharacterized protein n=1 Tax=Popillia japonica TaxID=7064 RepID=A0AAW1JW72_POPJA
MAVTLASFFVKNTNVENYVVYTGYLVREADETFDVHNVSHIYHHSNFIGDNNMDNVAIVKVMTNFALSIAGRAIAILPNNQIKFEKTRETTCSILIHERDVFGMGIFRSLPVDLLTKEECADLIGLNNLTLPLLTSSFCVKPHSSSDKKVDIIQGTTCLCDGIARGIIIQNHIGIYTRCPIPVIDIGLHTTWIRTRMINLEYVRSRSLNDRKHRNLIHCFLGVLYLYNYIY